MSERVRVIIFRDEGLWVAQCLEYDICVQGSNKAQMFAQLGAIFHLEDEQKGGIKRFKSAPSRFSKLWDSEAKEMDPSIMLPKTMLPEARRDSFDFRMAV